LSIARITEEGCGVTVKSCRAKAKVFMVEKRKVREEGPEDVAIDRRIELGWIGRDAL
jgi:hypothetical protein